MIPNGGRGGSPADTVALVGGTVAVALDPPELARADLVIAGGRIAAVGTAPHGTARRDCSGTLSPVGYAPAGGGGQRPALGTDGIDGDMFTESRAGFFRAKEAALSASPDWPLARLAASARFAGLGYGEPLLGTLVPGAPADVTER